LINNAAVLLALRLAFFAPDHDASIWLTGWYPQTLKMQVASVTADGVNLNRYWAAGTAPIFEIIAALDRFINKTSGMTFGLSSDPVSPQRSSSTPATPCSPNSPPRWPAR
jgi:hypothetical protein